MWKYYSGSLSVFRAVIEFRSLRLSPMQPCSTNSGAKGFLSSLYGAFAEWSYVLSVNAQLLAITKLGAGSDLTQLADS